MPPRWLLKISSKAHVFIYRSTGGKAWKTMNGLPVLLLTTTGRNTGMQRTTPVVFLRNGKDIIVAPGVVEKPNWYLNLKSHAQARIQIGKSIIKVRAFEAESEERTRLWMNVPDYWKDYQKKAKNQLPLIILRADE